MNEHELRAAIEAAHKAGDRERLSQLQARFRAFPLAVRNAIMEPLVQVDRVIARGGGSPPVSVQPRSTLHVRWRDDPHEFILVRGGARSRISVEAGDSRDGTETGGFLLASIHSDPLDIVAATGPGDDPERGAFSCTLDGESLDAWLRGQVERYNSDLIRVGLWHTHIAARVQPSPTDLEALSAGFAILEERAGPRARYVGIIATTRAYAVRDWRWQDLHAYVVRREPVTRRITCENARLKEVD